MQTTDWNDVWPFIFGPPVTYYLHKKRMKKIRVRKFESLHKWLMSDLNHLPPSVDWKEFEERVEVGLEMGQNIDNRTVVETIKICEKQR